MKRLGSAVLAGLLALPAAALTLPPCVGADLATPLPDASDVSLPVMDIPAARFPGQWQQGQFKGFAYRVFPDLTAIVFDERANTGWRIDLQCTEALRCVSSGVGSVPEAAFSAAKAIGDCLMPEEKPASAPVDTVAAPSSTAKPAPVKAPLPAVTSAPAPVNQAAKAAPDTKAAVPAEKPATPAASTLPAVGKPAAPAAPSKAAIRADLQSPTTSQAATAIAPDVATKTASAKPSAPAQKPSQPSNAVAPAPVGPKPARTCPAPSAQDAGSTIRAIQRLLVSAGKDPGPIDGIKGRRTVTALQATVGSDVAKLDPVSVLIALTAMICTGDLSPE